MPTLNEMVFVAVTLIPGIWISLHEGKLWAKLLMLALVFVVMYFGPLVFGRDWYHEGFIAGLIFGDFVAGAFGFYRKEAKQAESGEHKRRDASAQHRQQADHWTAGALMALVEDELLNFLGDRNVAHNVETFDRSSGDSVPVRIVGGSEAAVVLGSLLRSDRHGRGGGWISEVEIERESGFDHATLWSACQELASLGVLAIRVSDRACMLNYRGLYALVSKNKEALRIWADAVREA